MTPTPTFLLSKNRLTWHLLIWVILVFNSCVNTKKTGEVWIPKGQRYYKVAQNGAAVPAIYFKELTAPAKAQVVLPTTGKEYLSIKFTHPTAVSETEFDIPIQDRDIPIDQGSFFPMEPKDHKALGSTDELKKYVDGTFRYWQIQRAFQALTIPIQYRPRINEFTPAAASSNFNVGVGWVNKFTLTTYKKLYTTEETPVFLSHNIRNVAFSPGIFIAPTAIALTSANTNGVIKNNATVLGSTAGIIGVIGVDNLNFGVATGFDRTFGTFAKPWIYNKKAWVGLVFSIDFIK